MEQADPDRLSAPHVFFSFIHYFHLQERAYPMQTTTAGTIRLARTAEIPEGTGREFKMGERYRKRNRLMCYYSVAERCSFQSGNSKEGTHWDTSHKPH